MEVETRPVGHRDMAERKDTGAHYTPEALSQFVAKEMLKYWKGKDKSDLVTVLDPAIGDGGLIVALLDCLVEAGYSNIKVTGYDTDEYAISHCTQDLGQSYPAVQFDLKNKDFLVEFVEKGADNLFCASPMTQFDLIITNPPYVRTQELGADEAQNLAQAFQLKGRVDLYYAFILCVGDCLNPSGRSGVIVSNRFMTVKAGSEVRSYMGSHLNIECLWDLGDTKLFDAAVLPLVFVAGKGHRDEPTTFISIYSEKKMESVEQCDLFEAIESGLDKVHFSGGDYRICRGILDTGDENGSIWRLETKESREWLSKIKSNTHCLFADVNKIKVGIKTTADKVFLKQDWLAFPEDEKPELLRPVITHHGAKQFATPLNEGSFVLYPHENREGKRRACKLDDYPKTEKFLLEHEDVLRARTYLAKTKSREWYEVWVPHNPDLWKHPKIVFRDISAEPIFWLDMTGAVVNGDCYWLSSEGHSNLDLIWLALAVGNSKFIEKFYDCKFNNKLYAGRRRFITQYVEKFPLPDPTLSTSQEIIKLTRDAYEDGSFKEDFIERLNTLVNEAFGVN